jgi:serine/threonine-protein kinase
MNDSPQFPRALGRYELVHQLGQGGMGEVYLAKISGAAGFEKPCIVKTILPSLLKDQQFLERFRHEANVLVHLGHSSIAQVYDMGEAEGTYYMALEYVAGVDLAYLQEQVRAQGQALPVPVALLLGQRIAEGLGFAHRKTGSDGMPLGIVHRDVSPHNVMVSYEGEIKVIDFGLAKSAARSKHTQKPTIMGKLGYMSPEQVRAEAVDHRSDIFSCGVVVWELLAGRPLVAQGTVGEMMAAMSNPQVPALHELRPDVDPALDAVVRRALAPSPDERYARADDFARALNEQFLRTGSSFGAEEVGNFVRGVCPEAFANQRKLLSRISSSGLGRTPAPGGLKPLNTGRFTPAPGAGGDLDAPFEATLVRSPGSNSAPVVPPVVAAETQQLERAGGVGRKGWTLALTIGALGLIGGTAGVTALVMNRPPPGWEEAGGPGMHRPPPPGMHPPHGGPPGEHRGPPGGGPGMHRPPPPPPPPPDMREGGPPPRAEDPGAPGATGAMAEPPRPPEPRMAPVEATEPTAPVAAVSQPSKPRAQLAGAKFVPAENVVVMRPAPSQLYVVPRGRLAGLTRGMVLQVVAGPVRDGKARLLGEATIVEVFPRRAALEVEPQVREAGQVERFVVLPDLSTQAEPEAAAAEKPAAPRELNGRISLQSVAFNRHLLITNTDTHPWSGCRLVMKGRDFYELGNMDPQGTQEIALSDFKKGGRDVPFVGRNRVGLFCAEGQREFSIRL